MLLSLLINYAFSYILQQFLSLLKISTTTTNSTATDSNLNRKRVRSEINSKLDVMHETELPAKEVRLNLAGINAKKSTPELTSCVH